MDMIAAADMGLMNSAPESIRVLVIDDDAASRSALLAMLSAWRVETVAVNGTEDALTAFGQAGDDRRPFALVILAVGISRGKALELAQRLRGPDLTGPAVILLETAAEAIEAETLRALGIRACLRKPVQESELKAAITASIASESLERLRAFSSQGAGRALHILVAGADAANCQLLRQILERRGHSVALASSGREAVEATASGTFDLALLDILMPEMSGIEAAAAIRAREGAAARLGIVATAANAMPGDQERCLAAGMDGYIAKPFHPGELFEIVEKLSIIIQVPAPAVLFDGSLFEGDPEFLAEIVGLFLDTYPELLSTIEDAIKRGDAVGLAKAAHTMKGAVANFGAKAAVEQARALEMMGKSGDLSSAEQGGRTLRALLTGFEPVLQLALKRANEEQVVM